MRLRPIIVTASFFFAHHGLSRAAENFACGPGGKPNATTARCDCPAGRFEQTSGGTSRCVAKPSSPKPPSAPSCPPGTVSHQGVCTSLCASDETWNGTLCARRCTPTEKWNGAACEATSTPVACEEGRVADAAGHCCYPGQAWGDESGRCRGKPACPKGFSEADETCKLQCADGMNVTTNGAHCCWPGQEWSSANGACVGEADCPPSFDREGATCVHHAKCDDGKVALDDQHCCWVGQKWSESGCHGAPTCPSDRTRDAEDCLSPEAVEARVREDHAKEARARAWLRGVGSVSFLGVAYTYATTKSGAHASYADWALYLHTPDFPLLMHAELGAGRLAGNGTSGIAHVAFGAAFAPLSLPNAAESAFSWLNPSLGFAYHRFFSAESPSATLSPAPGSFGALTLEIADTISIVQRLEPHHNGVGLSVRFGYARGLLSGDYVPTSSFFIVASLSAFADTW
jgi:hypothetical protein